MNNIKLLSEKGYKIESVGKKVINLTIHDTAFHWEYNTTATIVEISL